jgi:translation initiation factor IF-2
LKIDKEGVNTERILTDLLKYDIMTEDFGGDVQCSFISAKKGTGIDDLLEKVLLQVFT